MRIISRMTTTYDVEEDRLRLSVTDKQGQRMLLWLTQRLAGRMITALLGKIERTVAEQAPPSARKAVQMMEQVKADLQRKPLPPVQPEPEPDAHLVTNIRIGQRNNDVVLNFLWGDEKEDAIALAIDRTRLRQWMRIFHEHYQRGGWPLDIWPQWFDEATPTNVLGKEQIN